MVTRIGRGYRFIESRQSTETWLLGVGVEQSKRYGVTESWSVEGVIRSRTSLPRIWKAVPWGRSRSSWIRRAAATRRPRARKRYWERRKWIHCYTWRRKRRFWRRAFSRRRGGVSLGILLEVNVEVEEANERAAERTVLDSFKNLTEETRAQSAETWWSEWIADNRRTHNHHKHSSLRSDRQM